MRRQRPTAWKYIRNLHPEYFYTTHIDLVQADPAYFGAWQEKAGSDAKAAAVVKRYHERPPEELYDLRVDPLELRNLAADPKYASRLAEMRRDVDARMKEQGDAG